MFCQGIAEKYNTPRGAEYWPSQKPGCDFFELYLCRFNVKESKAKTANVGHATYLFDLGRANNLAVLKKVPLAIVTWAGAEEEAYDQSSPLISRHIPIADRLMQWVGKDKKPSTTYEESAWFYSIPLTSVNTEDDVKRLLVEPLVALAKKWPLTKAIVEDAFKNTPEVLSASS